MQAKSVNAGQGAGWFKCGWNLFKQDYGTWFIMFLVFIGLTIVLNFIPFIGPLASMIISPALMAGFMYAAAELESGNSIEIGYLFQGFKDKGKMNKLLTLGGLYLLVQILLMLAMGALVGTSAVMSTGETGNINPEEMMTAGMGISMLLVLLVGITVMFGFVYATPLIMLDNFSPMDAIKASYSACFKNVLPLLVFGLIFILLAVIAMIPVGLGFLILLPVSFTAMYCSYKSIFH